MDDNLLQPQPLDVVLADIQDERANDKAIEQEQTQVVVTPAWKEVISKLETKSSPEAIIARIKALVYDGNTSNESLGEKVRVAVMSADDLKNTIDQVIETVKAHEK